MNVPITSEPLLKALAYLIAVADNSGVAPTRAQVDAYALAEYPRSRWDKSLSGVSRYSGLMRSAIAYGHEDDSTTDYLVATGLAASNRQGVHITELGRAYFVGVPPCGSCL